MQVVSVCVGDYAEKPYYVPGVETAVYCMEELCYCLRENSFLLDVTLMAEQLADWVERECGLPEVSDELRNMMRNRVDLSDFVSFLLDYVMLYGAEVTRDVADAVKKGAGLSSIEKRKKQIDYLVKKKKYPVAVHKYNELLYQWNNMEEEEETASERVVATILNNKGVALIGMMEYAEAAQCFLEAYEQYADRTYYESYLAAKRMELNESDYIAFAAELQGSYDTSVQLEKKMEQLRTEYEQQDIYKRLRAHIDMRKNGNRQIYYDECDRITRQLRADYRNSVGE